MLGIDRGGGMLAGCLLLALTPCLFSQVPPKQAAYVQLFVPANARVEIDGARTSSTGDSRRFVTPPLTPGGEYRYSVKITWIIQGLVHSLTREVRVRPGQETVLDLRNEKPDDATVRVIYVPTPEEVVAKMLELAKVTKDDVVYDLGCGDGRIVVTAARKYGARGVGVDLDPQRIKESLENVKKTKVEELVEIREGDALKVEDIGKATVVTLYMLPEFNLRLRPILEKNLKPGTRIVAHDYGIEGWKPMQGPIRFKGPDREHYLFLYQIAAPKKDE
jgi:uncharacterized protein (TIGR03000 family)